MRSIKFLVPAALALCLTASAVPAFADYRGDGESYRVSGLGPYQLLHLLGSPGDENNIVVLIPASGCHLQATGATDGNWTEVHYRANNGEDYTGWADIRFLAPEFSGRSYGRYDTDGTQRRAEHGHDYRRRTYEANAPQQPYSPPGYYAQPDQRQWDRPADSGTPSNSVNSVYTWDHHRAGYYGF